MSYYENVFIARQDVTVAQVDALISGFCKVIEDHGGKVANVERWGLRSLAYKIKKNRKGHYILINIEALGEAIHEMERQMRLNEDVLRYMTIRVDALATTPSPLAQVATERHAELARNEKISKASADATVADKARAKDDKTAKTTETIEAKEPDAKVAEDVKGDKE